MRRGIRNDLWHGVEGGTNVNRDIDRNKAEINVKVRFRHGKAGQQRYKIRKLNENRIKESGGSLLMSLCAMTRVRGLRSV